MKGLTAAISWRRNLFRFLMVSATLNWRRAVQCVAESCWHKLYGIFIRGLPGVYPRKRLKAAIILFLPLKILSYMPVSGVPATSTILSVEWFTGTVLLKSMLEGSI